MIHRLFHAPDGTIRVLIQGMARIQLGKFTQIDPYLKAEITAYPEIVETGLEIEALARNSRVQFEKIAELITSLPRELVASVLSINDPLQLVYNIANLQRMELSDAQDILETNAVSEKFKKLFAVLTRETEVLELGQKIQNEAKSEIEGIQREYYLREQMKAIQQELGEKDERASEVDEYRQKMREQDLPKDVAEKVAKEIDRLEKMSPMSAESGVIRTYLDWLLGLPWTKETPDRLDIDIAEGILEEDHYGLEKVKEGFWSICPCAN